MTDEAQEIANEEYGEIDPKVYRILKEAIGRKGIEALCALFDFDLGDDLLKPTARNRSDFLIRDMPAGESKGARLRLSALVERILTKEEDMNGVPLGDEALKAEKLADLENLRLYGGELVDKIGNGLPSRKDQKRLGISDDEIDNFLRDGVYPLDEALCNLQKQNLISTAGRRL